MKTRWFLHFFRKSISQRKGRVVIASLSVTLAVAVVTSMISITAGIKEKLGSELKAYGANIMVSPEKDAFLDAGMVDAFMKLPGVEDATGQVFDRVMVQSQVVELIGLDVGRLKDRGWRLHGLWPVKEGEVMAGINLKTVMKLQPGSQITLEYGGRRGEFTLSGFFEKGGSEDSAIIVPLAVAWHLTGMHQKLNAILIRGRSGALDEIVQSIRGVSPDVLVRTLRQVAKAEESLLMKIQLLMGLVTIVVLLATAISVASTMGANVLERRGEIGLMKAMGATRREISSFYAAEAVLIGLAGGVAGFILGAAAAEAVSKGAFNSFVGIPALLPFASLLFGLAVALIAGYAPVRNAMRYDPAVILRGE